MLDLVGEIPDVPDLSGMIGRLREAIGRFDLESLVIGDATGADRVLDARVLLVGWNREGLDADLAAGSGAAQPAAARIADPADFARLHARNQARPVVAPVAASATAPVRWAIVTLAPEADPFSPAETALLRLLGRVVQERLDRAAAPPTGRRERPLLSPRERECLQWTAAGKTTWEIAGILEISSTTTDGYIASAAKKLGAVNRTQAVAEAIRRGLID